jgi:hypothetical protein
MNTPAPTPFPADDWMIGGSTDAAANAVLGFTEAEVAQLAVEAYQYAADKARGAQPGNKGVHFRGMVDLCSELENLLAERLQLDPPESYEHHTD